jgi:hypothetical protein
LANNEIIPGTVSNKLKNNPLKMTFDKKDKIEILENSISWIVVLAMFIYGGAKLFQFEGATEINKTVSEMT